MLQAVDEDLGGGDVGGHGDVVHIADAQQVHLVGFTGLGSDGVAEEQQHVHFLAGDTSHDLLAAAMAAGQELLHGQADVFLHQAAGRAGGNQVMLCQYVAISRAELHHQLLFGVMCNQSDRHE